jgi:hypothetical protein
VKDNMPTKTIQICCSCGKKTCDGGVWLMISCIRDGREKITEVHPDNLYGCTLQEFGTGRKYQHLPLGTEVIYTRPSWSKPAVCKYKKVEM